MSVSVERERDKCDGLIDDDEEDIDENRIESAAATRAPLRRRLLPLPLLPLERRPAARRRPVLASMLVEVEVAKRVFFLSFDERKGESGKKNGKKNSPSRTSQEGPSQKG